MKAVTNDSKGIMSTILLGLVGLFAGFTNGLLGAGGGILIVFGMSRLLKSETASRRDHFANALAVMLPISIVSAISYLSRGRMSGVDFEAYLIPSIAGGILGGYLLDRLKLPLLKRLFALIVVWSGVYMLLGK